MNLPIYTLLSSLPQSDIPEGTIQPDYFLTPHDISILQLDNSIGKVVPLLLLTREITLADGTSDISIVAQYDGYLGQDISPGVFSDMYKWVIRTRMNDLAKVYNLSKTNNFEKIVNARALMKLNWTSCPCGGDGRGCISDKCFDEIRQVGQCHCKCFQLNTEDDPNE